MARDPERRGRSAVAVEQPVEDRRRPDVAPDDARLPRDPREHEEDPRGRGRPGRPDPPGGKTPHRRTGPANPLPNAKCTPKYARSGSGVAPAVGPAGAIRCSIPTSTDQSAITRTASNAATGTAAIALSV